MILRTRIQLVVLVVVALATIAGVAEAASWRVEQDGSGQFTSLQPAVDAAASGDTILIGPGWYQELHWVDHFGRPIEVAAYWTDSKDLSFVGTSAAEVTIGPVAFVQYLDGPVGIFPEGLSPSNLYVSGITFVNLYIGAGGIGSVHVSNCVFEGGATGVGATRGSSCIVEGSRFIDLQGYSCVITNTTNAEVANCELGAYVYFGSTGSGIIRNCTATGNGLGTFYLSSGLVEDNTANTTSGPTVVGSDSTVQVRRNLLSGGDRNVVVSGSITHMVLTENTLENASLFCVQVRSGATLEASGNDIIKAYGADKLLVSCESYPGTVPPVVLDMKDNYWAQAYTGAFESAAQVAASIHDYNDDPSVNVLVDFEPFSTQPVPVESTSFGSVKAMYRGGGK